MTTVSVDRQACTGHARCVAFAPDVFDLNDEGTLELAMSTVPESELEAVQAAVLNCPERALSLQSD